MSKTKNMTFLEHLEELRWTLVRVVLFIMILMIAGFIYSDYIQALIMKPIINIGLENFELQDIKITSPFMVKIVIALFTLSICLASGNIQKQMDDLMRSLQYKYQISGPEDLYKLKTQQTPQHGRTASRDMEDLVGDWMMEEEKNPLGYVWKSQYNNYDSERRRVSRRDRQ